MSTIVYSLTMIGLFFLMFTSKISLADSVIALLLASIYMALGDIEALLRARMK